MIAKTKVRPTKVTAYMYGDDEHGRCMITVSPSQVFEVQGADEDAAVLRCLNETERNGILLQITRDAFEKYWEEV